MAEKNDTIRIPTEATNFADNDQVDLHMGRPEAISFETNRLATQAMSIAAGTDRFTNESLEIAYPNLVEVKLYTVKLARHRTDEVARHLNILDEAA